MYRSSGRTRRGALRWLGICAAVLVLGWPGGSPAHAALMSLTAAGRPASVGADTLMVSPTSVTASATTMLTFTFTANLLLHDGTLTLTVPPGSPARRPARRRGPATPRRAAPRPSLPRQPAS